MLHFLYSTEIYKVQIKKKKYDKIFITLTKKKFYLFNVNWV